MLTVHTMISHIEGDVKKGTSQRRYHGNTTGAQMSVAAIGQANVAGDNSADALLKYIAVPNPTTNATAASNWGGANRWNNAKMGPLKRKLVTYVPIEPIGMRPWLRKGT